MFICYDCGDKLSTNDDLLTHIKVAHINSNIFRCYEDDCLRSFSRYYCFWKHRKRDHQNSNVTSSVFYVSHLNNQDALEFIQEANSSQPLFDNNIDIHEKISENGDNEIPTETGNDLSGIEDSFHSINMDNDDANINYSFDETVNYFFNILIAKWHSIPNISRKCIQLFITDLKSIFTSKFMNILYSKVTSKLESKGSDKKEVEEIESMFITLKSCLNHLDTEHKRLQYYEKLGTYIPPVRYTIGYDDQFRYKNGKTIIKKIPITVEYIEIDLVLSKFFCLPNMYHKVFSYVQLLKNDNNMLLNIIQCDLWKKQTSHLEDKFVLPLILYFDEYETNNPLGSHKGLQKCGALYIKIPCLPPELQSKLNNIFLFGLFNSLDRDNSKVYRPAIEKLNKLETNGIEINIDDQIRKIYFKLITIVGDNLGLHQLFGLAQNFNAKNFCRFCYTNRNDIDNVFDESNCILRTKESYEEDLISKTRGVVKESVLKDLPNFHFTQNLVVDLMHDILEGVAEYDLGNILHFYIHKKNPYFTLTDFNSLVRGHNYNINDARNKPSDLTYDHLKNKKYTMTASEMLCLIKNLPMIIGHLVPIDDEHWELVKLLNEIILCVTSKYLQFKCHNYLDYLISEYLFQLQKLFPKSFKPKHHFLIHYARVMKLSGPLWHIASMNFERKHRSGKITAHVSINRKNIFYTIAMREQLTLNYRFLQNKNNLPEIIVGSVKKMFITHELQKDHNFNSWIGANPGIEQKLLYVSWISYRNEILKPFMVLMIPNKDGFQFYLLNYILKYNSQLVFVVRQLVCSYAEHFQAFRQNYCEDNYELFYWHDIRLTVFTHRTRLGDGNIYVCKKWF